MWVDYDNFRGKPRTLISHLGRTWTIRELAQHYNVRYDVMQRKIRNDKQGLYKKIS